MKNGLAAIPNQEEDVEIGHAKINSRCWDGLARDTAEGGVLHPFLASIVKWTITLVFGTRITGSNPVGGTLALG